MYSMTIFKSTRWWDKENRYVYDNKTHRRMDFESWDKFVNFLGKLSERKLNGKQDAELITPAIFKPNSTRKNDNVIAWAGWAALDVDDITFDGNLEDELRKRFGEFNFVHELKGGDRISIEDAGGYTMVKKNWFNGVKMPSIAIKELDGSIKLIREFGYQDFVDNLS